MSTWEGDGERTYRTRSGEGKKREWRVRIEKGRDEAGKKEEKNGVGEGRTVTLWGG